MYAAAGYGPGRVEVRQADLRPPKRDRVDSGRAQSKLGVGRLVLPQASAVAHDGRYTFDDERSPTPPPNTHAPLRKTRKKAVLYR
jgi:hypothetical protein